MKKRIIASLLCLSSAFSYAEMGVETQYNKTIEKVNGFFPKVEGSFVGDPMPMVDGDVFNVFYLNDIRGGSDLGVHAFHLLETKNLYDYVNHSEILPYINELDNPELLLGTGSIIKVDETWHAWYTAHNENVFPVESVMHATSKDKLNWIKTYDDTILPGKNYSGNDFRDPHVVYIPEVEEYWMLITTRQNGNGVIVRYVSKDLKHWEDKGVFFNNDTLAKDANLECPTLLFFKGKWYLSFSDQWPTRLTQYRVADNPEGPFVKINQNNAFDGAGFYAGKMTLKNDRLYVFGWNPTKTPAQDDGNIDWAGNLIVHELNQNPDHSLSAVMPKELTQVIHQKTVAVQTPKVISDYHVQTNFGELNMDVYSPFSKNVVIEASIKNVAEGVIFSFNVDEQALNEAPLNIVFNKNTNHVFFYNSPLNNLNKAKPELGEWVDLRGDIDLKIVIEDSIAVFYINDKSAFTVRMYGMVEHPWGISVSAKDKANAVINLKIKEIK